MIHACKMPFTFSKKLRILVKALNCDETSSILITKRSKGGPGVIWFWWVHVVKREDDLVK